MRGKMKGPTVEDFREAAPVGTSVRFYPVLPADEDAFTEHKVTSEPYTMGGRTVVFIEGKRGSVDCGHLAIINPVRRIRGVCGFIDRA
jgi:hypothetical protein